MTTTDTATAQPPATAPTEAPNPLAELVGTFGKRLRAHRTLDTLSSTYLSHSSKLSETLAIVRAGHLPSSRRNEVRANAIRLKSQVTELLSLLS